MKIIAIIAGTNEPSNCAALASAFIEGIRKTCGHCDVGKIQLKDLRIEHFSLKNYDAGNVDEEDFRAIHQLICESDGVVIAAPVWNFGVPAHLKNLIDRMGSFALDETKSKGILDGKPFYLIFTGGAPPSAWNGIMRKTTSFVPEGLRYFGASVIGSHFEGRCTPGKGKFGLVVDKRPESLAGVRRKGADFADVVKEYAKTGKLPAKHALTKKVYEWGQGIIGKLT